MYPSNRYDPSRRRRRRHAHPSPLSTAASVATAAALAYGAYKLGSYVWNSYQGYESDEDEGGDVYDVNQRGRHVTEDEPRSYRSRRSRVDWSEMNHRRRSHRPSPGEDYEHHDVRSSGVASISEEREAVPPAVRSARMARCRTEISRAMMDFLPTLKKAVVKHTDTSFETDELKQLRVARREGAGDDRSRERQLWNEIKNKSVTRLLTTVYAHSILFLVLTVQVNLLGGRLLREEGEETASSGEAEEFDGYRASHQLVLAKTYEHIFAKGIPALAEAVSAAVRKVVIDWDVLGVFNGCDKKDSVSMRDVSNWIEQIRDEVEQRNQKGSSPMSALAKFIIPEECGNSQDASIDGGNVITDELAKYILDETYDLLESPTFALSESTCLDATFSYLQNNGYAKLFAVPQSVELVPLAAAITHLQKTAVSTFYKPPSRKDEIESWGGVLGMMEEPLPSDANIYIPMLERSDAILELASVCFD